MKINLKIQVRFVKYLEVSFTHHAREAVKIAAARELITLAISLGRAEPNFPTYAWIEAQAVPLYRGVFNSTNGTEGAKEQL